MKIIRYISSLICMVLVAVCGTSCLDSKESETVVNNVYNAVVTGFSLESNSDVCANLSGYTFTIDNYGTSDEEIHSRFPDDGIIFNPDSLPVGAIPDSIKVSLSFASPDSVYFQLRDPWGKLGQYSTYSKDSALYFASYPDSRLTIVARGVRKTYHIKINVHKVKADTIAWHEMTDQLWQDVNVTDHRVDTLGGRYFWLAETGHSADKVSSAPLSDLQAWQPLADVVVEDGDLLDLSTLYSWHGSLYAIGRNGHKLYNSADGSHWDIICGNHTFESLLGYQPSSRDGNGTWTADSLNAVVKVDGVYRFATSANAQQWTVAQTIPANFPVRGFSRPIAKEARHDYGNLTSRLYLTGGMTTDGSLVAGTWSCDGWNEDVKGPNWVCFEQNEMPAMTGATVLEYTFDVNKPKSIWILQPGSDDKGNIPYAMLYGKKITTLYFSEDHGVSWHRLFRTYRQYADNASLGTISCHSGFVTDDYRMVFFGGCHEDGSFNTAVWGGRLNSLTFQNKK